MPHDRIDMSVQNATLSRPDTSMLRQPIHRTASSWTTGDVGVLARR